MSGESHIDKDSSVPIYFQIVNWITAKIKSGGWQTNQKLPSEPDLASELEISRGSLRKAISILVSQGLLEQVHGRGTYVREPLFTQSWANRLVSTSEEFKWRGIPFSTEVLAQEIITISNDRIANILQLKSGEEVFHLLRRRIVDKEVLVVHETFFPASKYSDMLEVDFTVNTLVTDVLEGSYKLVLSRASHNLSAVSANKRVSEWLNVRVGSPVLFDENILYDDKNLILAFSKSWFRSDKMQLKSVVYRMK